MKILQSKIFPAFTEVKLNSESCWFLNTWCGRTRAKQQCTSLCHTTANLTFFTCCRAVWLEPATNVLWKRITLMAIITQVSCGYRSTLPPYAWSEEINQPASFTSDFSRSITHLQFFAQFSACILTNRFCPSRPMCHKHRLHHTYSLLVQPVSNTSRQSLLLLYFIYLVFPNA